MRVRAGPGSSDATTHRRSTAAYVAGQAEGFERLAAACAATRARGALDARDMRVGEFKFSGRLLRFSPRP